MSFHKANYIVKLLFSKTAIVILKINTNHCICVTHCLPFVHFKLELDSKLSKCEKILTLVLHLK